MAIVINGSGTVTGLAVGGLPDGTVDAGTLATNSVDSAELIDGSIDTAHIAADQITSAIMPAGHILQMVQATIGTATTTTTNGSWIDTSSLLAITPSSTSSKILALVTTYITVNNDAADVGFAIRLSRAISGGSTTYPDSLTTDTHGSIGAMYRDTNGSTYETHQQCSIMGYDSPSTTSATTYKVQMQGYSANATKNNAWGDTNITLIEIKG
jgi:hypothetical protein